MTRNARRAEMVRRVLLPLALVGLGAAAGRATLDNGLARTPPMGWNSWNHFGCDVSARLIRETADGMVASGMRDAGYRYVVIDDCWQVARDPQGRLVADSARFPGGIKPLADYVHAQGLKFGIYTDAGRKTCQGRPGTYGHEVEDARTFAAWGVDYVKEDWCYADSLDAPIQYAKFRDALRGAGRPGRRLERPRHAGGRQRWDDRRGVPRPLQPVGDHGRAADRGQRPPHHDICDAGHPHESGSDRCGPRFPGCAGDARSGGPARAPGVGETVARWLPSGGAA